MRSADPRHMSQQPLRSSETSECELRNLLSHSARKSGVNQGVEAFEELCSKCDPESLAGLFLWVRALHQAKPEVVEMSDGSSALISYRMLDDWKTAIGNYDLRKLKQIAKQATDLKEEINELSKTYLVQHLISTGEIAGSDLLASGLHLDSRFQGLQQLPKLIRGCGPKQSIDLSSGLVHMIGYVRNQTGKPRYGLIADILSALIGSDHSEDSLKQLYSRRRRKLSKSAKNRS